MAQARELWNREGVVPQVPLQRSAILADSKSWAQCVRQRDSAGSRSSHVVMPGLPVPRDGVLPLNPLFTELLQVLGLGNVSRECDDILAAQGKTIYLIRMDPSTAIETICRIGHIRWDVEDCCFRVLSERSNIKDLDLPMARGQMLLAFSCRERICLVSEPETSLQIHSAGFHQTSAERYQAIAAVASYAGR